MPRRQTSYSKRRRTPKKVSRGRRTRRRSSKTCCRTSSRTRKRRRSSTKKGGRRTTRKHRSKRRRGSTKKGGRRKTRRTRKGRRSSSSKKRRVTRKRRSKSRRTRSRKRGGRRTSCPKGKILRTSFYFKRNGKTIYVPATCVKDKGAKGKTPKSRRVLPTPTKNALGKYGYSNLKNKSTVARHRALTKGVKKEGYATLVRRVNLIRNYNKNNKTMHDLLSDDLKWMKCKLAPKYAKSAATRKRASKSC